MIVVDGRPVRHTMRRELITEEDLIAHVREQGVEDIRDVKRAYVEHDGTISVLPYRHRD